MKKYLITLMFAAFAVLRLEAQTEKGGFISPVFELSEIDGSVAFGTGAELGFVSKNWHLSTFGMRTSKALRPGEQAGELYNINLITGGLQGKYFGAVAENMSLSVGMRAAGGKVEREWLLSSDRSGKEQAYLWLLTPEIGIEVSVSERFHIGYAAGFRWVTNMQPMDGISKKELQSLVSTLTIKIGWLDRW